MSSRLGTMRRVDPGVVRRALARPSPFPPHAFDQEEPAPSPAAVCVPLAFDPEPVAYAVLRAATLRDHGGEVAFPGGKPEAGDADLRATALRELGEEVALHDVDVLGVLSTVPVVTGRYLIHPIVADVRGARPTIRASEVAEILPIPLLPYLTGAAVYEAVQTRWRGLDFLTPHFHLDARTRADVVLYGATAFMLWELLMRVAAELGETLPAPVIVDSRPWGERYGSR